MKKVCEKCGREIEWRKKWQKNWDTLKFCSEKCRRNKSHVNYEEEILIALKSRGFDKTICPSEILPVEHKKDKNRMEEVRQAARRLVAKGQILIVQKGQVVDPSSFRGPIRLRLVR